MSQANGGVIRRDLRDETQHGGNRFEHLYARRSFQAAVAF